MLPEPGAKSAAKRSQSRRCPRVAEAGPPPASPRSRCARSPAARRVSSSKRASASASRSVSKNSKRVTRPSAPKTQSMEELPLEGAAAGAVGAEDRPAHEERIGPQAEDVVDAAWRCRRRARAGRGSAAAALPRRARTRSRGSGGRRTRWRVRTPWRSDRGRTVPAAPRPSAPSPRRGRARGRRGGARRSARTAATTASPSRSVAKISDAPASPLRVDLDQDDLSLS